jgi:hypothetical protein
MMFSLASHDCRLINQIFLSVSNAPGDLALQAIEQRAAARAHLVKDSRACRTGVTQLPAQD